MDAKRQCNLAEASLPTEQKETEPERLRTWLRDVMQATGLKATPLAQKAGLAPSTIIRALDPDGPGYMSTRTIEKIVETFGVPPPGGSTTRPRGFAEGEVEQLKDAPSFADPRPTAGRGVWRINSRALDLSGYVPGDIVLADASVEPQPFDVVCAQVYNFERGSAETVLRVFDPPYLVTHSSDPACYRKPLLVDNERVVIWGTVIRTVRERSAA